MQLLWQRSFHPVIATKQHCHQTLNKPSFLCHKRALIFVPKAKYKKEPKIQDFHLCNRSWPTFAEPLFQEEKNETALFHP